MKSCQLSLVGLVLIGVAIDTSVIGSIPISIIRRSTIWSILEQIRPSVRVCKAISAQQQWSIYADQFRSTRLKSFNRP